VAHATDLARLLQVEPMELLWQHTVLPYATAYFERPVFDNALAAALSTGRDAIGMGAVTQSVSDLVPFRRFCVACAREDRRRWRESYWHREHNLPGVRVCLRHGSVLRQSQLRSTGWEGRSERLPHEVPGQRLLHRRVTPFDVELGRRSVALLGREPGAQVERDQVWYRTRLIDGGLLTPTRPVNAQKLVQWVREQMGGPATGYGLNERDAELRWLALMVRPRSGHPFVPLKHLLFETALATHAQAPEATKPLLDHVSSGPGGRSPAEMAALDREYAAAVRKVVAGYVKRGERVRIQDALTEAGCWAPFRHGRTGLPRTSREVARLLASAAAMRRPVAGRRE
jgi:hypothetical protein